MIADLAAKHDAVAFEPHITVVGGINGDCTTLTEMTRSFTAETSPLSVTFGDVRCSTTRHQCIFLLVDPSKVCELARGALGLPCEAYLPHLSLVSERGGDRHLHGIAPGAHTVRNPPFAVSTTGMLGLGHTQK